MKQYLELLDHVMRHGTDRLDRTGTGTRGVFGHQTRYNLRDGFPLVTTKKVHFKSVVYELLWFLRGDTNVKFLQDNGVRIWNEWACPKGDLGPVYGKQWVSWVGHDGKVVNQINDVVKSLQTDPFSRRHIVTAWNPTDIPDMKLPPCHMMFQFHVTPVTGAKNRLSCQLYQRSADLFLGVPFNIASYALLTHMVAQVCDLDVGDFIHTLGDAHIYSNHFEQVEMQLSRSPKPRPTLKLDKSVRDIFSFKAENISLLDYDAHPHIKGKVAV